jgi:hypothetical protein
VDAASDLNGGGAELADPRAAYVLVITLISGSLGALGAALRRRREQRTPAV